MNIAQLQCVKLLPEHEAQLAALFRDLLLHGLETFFHPHPLTAQEASILSSYSGLDFHCVLLLAGKVIGYGMLRGWDEGYTVPSLGMAIHPLLLGRGYGRFLIKFLHEVARRRGAEKIRLKVYPDNVKAMSLYKSEGYVFNDGEAGQLLGVLSLG